MLRLACSVLVLAASLSAQTTQGVISGRVYDRKTTQTIPGAKISVTNLALSETRTVESNEDGTYALMSLSPGTYSLQVSKDGYQSAETYEIELPVAGRTSLDLPLRVSTDVYSQGVYQGTFLPESYSIVHVYAADIQTTYPEPLQVLSGRANSLHSTLSYVFDSRQWGTLPLFGRDVYTMQILLPGVTSDSSTARGLGISANGQRPSASNFLLDGLENNNYLVTGPLTTLSLESVQEYRVSTNNFSAEYGRTSGYFVNAVTRSGGSQWHGLGYLYLKHDSLNANDFQRNRMGEPRAFLRETQPGFWVGGPLDRQRLFGSVAFERLRFRSQKEARYVQLPTTSFVPDPGTIAERLLQTYQRPQVSSENPTAPVKVSPPSTLNRSLGLGRIDFVPGNGRQRLLGRVALASLDRPDMVWTPYEDFATPLTQDSPGVGLNWIASSSKVTSEFRLGWSSDNLGLDRSHPEIPVLQSFDKTLLPGSPVFYSYRNRTRNWELVNNLMWLKGWHMIKLGGGFLLRGLDGHLTTGRDGYLSFPNVHSFGKDRPSSGSVGVKRLPSLTLLPPDYDREYRHNQYFFFAQDTFQIMRRLVLDYGVRYENFGAPVNTGPTKEVLVELGKGGSLAQRVGSAELKPVVKGDQTLYASDSNDWALRVGLAYGFGSEMRTRIRGSYGGFYDRPFDNLWQTLRNNNVVLQNFSTNLAPDSRVDYLAPIFTRLPGFSEFEPDNTISRLTLMQPGLRTPYVHSFFLGAEHELTRKLTLELYGMASLGRKLITTDKINRAASLELFQDDENFLGYLNPELPLLHYRANQGSTNYSALSTVAHYRGERFQFQATYTWSHAIDNQSEPLAGEFLDLNFLRQDSSQAEATFSRQFDSRVDRGNSDFDQRHNFVFFWTWSVPDFRSSSWAARLLRDWTVSQIGAFRSGFPYTVLAGIVGGLPSGGGEIFGNRADIVDLRNTGADVDVAGGKRLLNSAGFRKPTGSRLGNSGRNAFRGPGFYSMDLSVSRAIPLPRLGEGARVVLRADFFNVLNHANLGNPFAILGGKIDAPAPTPRNFGVAPRGRRGRSVDFPLLTPLNETPREIQLMVRFEF